MNRRSFFEKTISALFGASGLAFFGTALAYVYPNKNFVKGTRQFIDERGKPVSPEEIEEGKPKAGIILGAPAIVMRLDGELLALSRVCTHLGCTVAFNAEEEIFKCPCHGGVYDIDGTVLEGPPPKPLVRLKIKIEDGKIMLA